MGEYVVEILGEKEGKCVEFEYYVWDKRYKVIVFCILMFGVWEIIKCLFFELMIIVFIIINNEENNMVK